MLRHRPRERYRVEHRPGGYQGWRDTTAIRRPNILKLFMAFLLTLSLCSIASGGIGFGVSYFNRSDGSAMTSTVLPDITFEYPVEVTSGAVP